MTGDVVGTLRYMSPEQARTRPGVVDHRTDVYSLGATLYELLTLRPTIPGNERHELLTRLALEEPVPPRRLTPALPADLETIVLKALAKEPAERYATAQEMGDDLRRFLEDRPILARRPTLAQRVAKWARRHQRMVAAVAVMLVLAVVGLAVSVVLISREKNRTEKAYKEAEAKRQDLRKVVDEWYLEAEKWMVDEVHQTRLQQFLEKVLTFYEQFAKDESAQPKDQLATAQARFRVGEIQARLGRYDKSEEAYRKAIALLEGLESATLKQPEFQYELALSYDGLYRLYGTISRLQDAEKAIRQSLATTTRLADAEPRTNKYRVHLVTCHCSLAELHYVAGRYREAGQAFRHTLALLNRLNADFREGEAGAEPEAAARRELSARVHDSLGYWYWFNQQNGKAEQAYRHARDSLQKLVDLPGTATRHRMQLAAAHNNLANVFLSADRFPEAREACQKAIVIQKKLAQEFPVVPRYRGDLASYHNALGIAFRHVGHLDKAETEYGRAVTLLEQLIAKFPDAPDFQMQLAASQRNLANLYWETGRPREAEAAFRWALDLDARLVTSFPKRPEYRASLGRTYRDLGRLLEAQDLFKKDRFEEAEKTFRQALAVYAELARDFPYLPVNNRAGANQRKPLGDLSQDLRLTGRPGQTDPVAPRALDLLTKLAANPIQVDYRSDVATCHNDLGRLFATRGEFRKAEKEFPQARDLFRKAEREFRTARDLFKKLAAGDIRNSPNFPYYRYGFVSCSFSLANVLGDAHPLRDKEQIMREKEDLLHAAVGLQDKLVIELPKEPLCRSQWAAVLRGLALTLLDQGDLLAAQGKLAAAQGRLEAARRLMEEQVIPRHLVLNGIRLPSDSSPQLQSEYFALARVCIRLRKHREAAQVAEEYRQLSSDSWKGFFDTANLLAGCILAAEKDVTLSPDARKAQVESYASQAKDLVKEALKLGENDPACVSTVAWMRANCPASQLRDVKGEKGALALARQAVERAGGQANFWTCLGAAHYRAGDWRAAIDALERSRQMEGKDTSYDLFFLAMAHWQLGERNKARRLYDDAVEVMKKTQADNKELQRFGGEAADLMGLPLPFGAGQAKPSHPPRAR
jgi:tetratricopeptide (TPR) repeat protein